MFRDRVQIVVRSGKGGDGSPHLRREKYIPKGGPDGGDGGRGGSVYVQAVEGMNTLYRYTWNQAFSAEHGGAGGARRRHGKTGASLTIDVPPGTQVYHAGAGEILADLAEVGQRVEVARGGRGGLGNTHFATPVHQTPRYADKGEPGEEVALLFELKLIADVGLVGLPNAGKSTLLSVVSAARPKIADYPFTTLEPNLGVVTVDDETLVVADIPGLIEGAHSGAGLGHEFLRHVERTVALIHVLDASSGDVAQILAEFEAINEELRLHDAALAERPQVVAANKMDLPSARAAWPALRRALEGRGFAAYAISAATGDGILPLLRHVWRLLVEARAAAGAGQEPSERELSDAELPVLAPAGAAPDDAFEVRRIPSGFRVRGRRAERIVAMTNLDTDEGIERLQAQLRRAGVTRALMEAGAKVGDQVFIGDVNFEWTS
jgi:GTP-binding protein